MANDLPSELLPQAGARRRLHIVLDDCQSKAIWCWGLCAEDALGSSAKSLIAISLGCEELASSIADGLTRLYHMDGGGSGDGHFWQGYSYDRGCIHLSGGSEIGWNKINVGSIRDPGMGPARSLAFIRKSMAKLYPESIMEGPFPKAIVRTFEGQRAWHLCMHERHGALLEALDIAESTQLARLRGKAKSV